MRRSFLCALALLCFVPSMVHAKEIWRCVNGDDVRFEQKTIPGYRCKRPSIDLHAAGSFSAVPTPSTSAHVVSSSTASVGSVSTTIKNPAIGSISTSPSQVESFGTVKPDTTLSDVGNGSVRGTYRASRNGAIYKRMVDGVVEFSSRPVGGGKVVARYVMPCYACRMGKSVDFASLPLNGKDYASAIAALAGQYMIDPAWVRAIVHAESNFNPNAISPKGAQGLMQLMPGTARRFGVSSPLDPIQNLAGGVQYLAWLLKRFNGDHALATAAYNAGEGAVDRYKGVPPYSETRTYVDRVSTLRARYATLR